MKTSLKDFFGICQRNRSDPVCCILTGSEQGRASQLFWRQYVFFGGVFLARLKEVPVVLRWSQQLGWIGRLLSMCAGSVVLLNLWWVQTSRGMFLFPHIQQILSPRGRLGRISQPGTADPYTCSGSLETLWAPCSSRHPHRASLLYSCQPFGQIFSSHVECMRVYIWTVGKKQGPQRERERCVWEKRWCVVEQACLVWLRWNLFDWFSSALLRMNRSLPELSRDTLAQLILFKKYLLLRSLIVSENAFRRQQAQMHLKTIMCFISITKVKRVSVSTLRLKSSTASQEYTSVTSQEVGREILFTHQSLWSTWSYEKRKRVFQHMQNNKIIQFNSI